MRPACPGGMSPGFAATSVPDWPLSGFTARQMSNRNCHVLAAWGIADADIPGVISALRLRLPVFAVPVLACLITAAWSHSPVSFLSLACIAPPCLLGMVTTLWRISILRHRRFTPLCRWLLRFRKRP